MSRRRHREILRSAHIVEDEGHRLETVGVQHPGRAGRKTQFRLCPLRATQEEVERVRMPMRVEGDVSCTVVDRDVGRHARWVPDRRHAERLRKVTC